MNYDVEIIKSNTEQYKNNIFYTKKYIIQNMNARELAAIERPTLILIENKNNTVTDHNQF